MSIHLHINKNEDTKKSIEEIEHALYHLIYQFRQINSKYGLIVREEINELYDCRIASIHSSKSYMEMLERKRVL